MLKRKEGGERPYHAVTIPSNMPFDNDQHGFEDNWTINIRDHHTLAASGLLSCSESSSVPG